MCSVHGLQYGRAPMGAAGLNIKSKNAGLLEQDSEAELVGHSTHMGLNNHLPIRQFQAYGSQPTPRNHIVRVIGGGPTKSKVSLLSCGQKLAYVIVFGHKTSPP